MKVSVYLHDEIRAILCCYGTLEEVVNKVLDAGSAGEFDVMNKPQIPVRDGAHRFEVDVTNEEYLAILRSYPPNSSKVSLRRLLYWFVENEMYEALGWEVTNKYVDNRDKKRMKLAKRIRQDLEALLQVVDSSIYNQVQEITNFIKELEN